MGSSFGLRASHFGKGHLWARGLRRAIIDYWYATLEGPEAAMLEAASATVATNILDETVFEDAHGDRYRKARQIDPRGRVVMGFELIRNCEIHAPELAELVEHARFGVPAAGIRSVFRWPPLEELPRTYRTKTAGEQRARGEARDAYRKWVANRTVADSLLDALAFFEDLEPRLRPDKALELEYAFVQPAPLGAQGEQFLSKPLGLDKFEVLLPDLACRPDERRSARWPSADQWLKEQNTRIRKEVPPAADREVNMRVVDEDGALIAYAGVSGGSFNASREHWVERTTQVGRDVRNGYSYFVNIDGEQMELKSDEQLRVSAPLPGGEDAIERLPSDGSALRLGHLQLLEANPDLYRRMRLAR